MTSRPAAPRRRHAASGRRSRRAAAVRSGLGLAVAVATLLLSAWAAAQPAPASLHGEVGVDTGVQRVATELGVQTRVPLRIRARLELDVPLTSDVTLEAIALPALGAGSGGDDPLLRHGLQEALLRVRLRDLDVTAGLERWPLGEMRLAPVVALDVRMEGGEPRGLLGARLTAFLHPWRARLGLAAPTGDDLLPDRWGGVASVRLDAGAATVEAHAFVTERPGVGLTASGSAGDHVVFGEAWLLAEPWDVRGGVGASGYAGDLLWTVEGTWAPEDGALKRPARPAVRAGGSVPVGRDGSLELGVGAAWPTSAAATSGRAVVLDGAVAWTIDRPEATLTVRPTVRHGNGVTAAGATLSLTSYF